MRCQEIAQSFAQVLQNWKMFVYLHSRCAEFAPGAVRSGGWRPPRKRGLRPAGTEGRGAGKVSARTRNEVAHAVAHAVAEAMKGLGLCCTGTRDGLYWSDGRVARQRSAKPYTAVRVRFRPHQNSVRNHSNAVFLFFCHISVIPPHKLGSTMCVLPQPMFGVFFYNFEDFLFCHRVLRIYKA